MSAGSISNFPFSGHIAFVFMVCLATMAPTTAHSQPSNEQAKFDKSFVINSFAFNEFRSVTIPLENPETGGNSATLQNQRAQTYGGYVGSGFYLDDHFSTQVRLGLGFRSDTIEETLEINMAYWAAWYLGYQMPVTDYFQAYFLAGVSIFEADVTRIETLRTVSIPGFGGVREEVQPVIPSTTRMEEDLFGTSFSFSWAIGGEIAIAKDWYLQVEYGRLLRDTDTNIQVFQGGLGIKYEY